jgi:hypothetical protein
VDFGGFAPAGGGFLQLGLIDLVLMHDDAHEFLELADEALDVGSSGVGDAFPDHVNPGATEFEFFADLGGLIQELLTLGEDGGELLAGALRDQGGLLNSQFPQTFV